MKLMIKKIIDFLELILGKEFVRNAILAITDTLYQKITKEAERRALQMYEILEKEYELYRRNLYNQEPIKQPPSLRLVSDRG